MGRGCGPFIVTSGILGWIREKQRERPGVASLQPEKTLCCKSDLSLGFKIVQRFERLSHPVPPFYKGDQGWNCYRVPGLSW